MATITAPGSQPNQDATAPAGSVPQVPQTTDQDLPDATAPDRSVLLAHSPDTTQPVTAPDGSVPLVHPTDSDLPRALLPTAASGSVPLPPLPEPAPVLLTRQGPLFTEDLIRAANISATDWEAEMQERGHLSQKAFSCNFAAPYECAVCDPMIVDTEWHVPPSRFNRAPHGMSGAPTRYAPTKLEFEAARQALIGQLAARVFVEEPPDIDPAEIADTKGIDQAISGQGNRTTHLAARLQVHSRLFCSVALAAALTAGASLKFQFVCCFLLMNMP